MTHVTIERAKAQRIADAFEDLKKNHGIVYVEESVDIKQALAAQQEHEPENEPFVSLASVQKPVARTDQQIVDQTEELAVWLLSWCFNHQPETDTPMRESTHPFAERCWAAACHIQEMLTATDPENSVAELDAETTPPKQPAVPDAIHHTDLSESLEYIQGWNECRQSMLEMMK